MNKVIEITIRNKVARIASSPIIVGKNKDYIVRFDFDEDWYKYDTKTARFSQDGEYQDIIFAGNECSMPALDGGKVVEVGVYAGDISTTTPAYLKVHKSIIDDDGVPADPTPDVYAQIMERFNAMEAPAAVLYTVQNLTDEQKAQARDNIGVSASGSGTDISLGIRGASAGQVPVVKSVDVNGVPNGWVAGDLPSGGSGDKEWKLLRQITVPEDPTTDESGVTWTVNDGGAVTGIEFDTDTSGNSFSCEELSITGRGVCSATGRLDYYVGTKQICAWNGQQQAASRYSWAWIRRLGSHWQVIGTIASANRWIHDMVSPSISGFHNGGETNISSVTALGLRGTQSYNAGYVFEIWGR